MSRPRSPVNRREFIQMTAGAVASPLLSMPASLEWAQPRRRRYALVGTGVRGCGMWGREVVELYSDAVDFVGLCDTNHKRLAVAKKLLGVTCRTFTNFDEMCEQAKPDLLAIATVDVFHSEYIIQALNRGIDVITEKPMVIDEIQCQAVLDAEKRNRRKITVAFNYRYAPKHLRINEILLAGEIGRVISVDLSWYLDIYHGADYFRRWHRLKSKAGTLLVHKATHHFDLMNWWLDADPVEVVAHASLEKYGRKGPFRYTHCRPCPHKSKCSFYYDITKNPSQMELYVACEDVDRYHRDGCVFREDVDIYDTMSALVRYSNGVTMNYSLNAFMPFEGYRLAFNGEKGRLEVRDYQRQPWTVEEETEIHLTKSFGDRVKIPVPQAQGAHAGGDDRLLQLIFRNADVPPYMRLPGSRAGALSCLTGIAARKSVEEKRAVQIGELIRL